MSLCPKTHFWKLYFSVAVAIFALLIVLLGIFWGFIASYENAQPETFAARYAAELTTDDLSAWVDAILPAVLSPYEDAGSVRAAHLAALSSLDGDITVRKNFLAYTADTPVFYLIKSGVTVAEITLAPAENGAFGLRRWQLQSAVVKTEDWAPQKNDYTLHIPKGAALSLNGISVPPESITESDTPYGFASVHEPAGTAFWDIYTVSGIYSTPDAVCTLNGEVCTQTTDGTAVYFRYPESLTKTYTVTAPTDALVLIGGTTPDTACITAFDIPYDYPAPESTLSALPTAVTYTVDGLFAPPEIEVTLNGTPLTVRAVDGGYTADYPASQLYTCTIRVPEGSKVSLYGFDCTPYKTGAEPVFSEFSDLISEMPVYDVYTVPGLFVSPAEAVAVNREGDPLSLTVSVDSFDVQCSAKFPKSENPTLDALASSFLVDYITYTGKGYSGIDENLAKVLSYVVKNSDTYTRIQKSREAISYVTPVLKTTYNRQEIVSSVRYADDLWEYAIDFDIEQNTAGYLRQYTGTFRLVFAKVSGEWKVADMDIVTK